MSETNPQTDPKTDPAETGAPSAAATPNPTDPGSAPDDVVTATPAPDDVKRVQADRDRNYEAARIAEDRIAELESFVEEQAAEKAIAGFLKDNSEDYPDLTFEDLKHCGPNNLKSEADRIQRRLQDHTQAKILDIEKNPNGPRLSPEQRAEREAELMKQGGESALAEVIALRMDS